MITDRNQFGKMIDGMGLKVGAEIGVAHANYSDLLLSTSQLSMLYLVDPWIHMDEFAGRTSYNDAMQEQMYQAVVKKMTEQHPGRFEIMRMKSEEAANAFNEGALDFVYIDANHAYEFVRQDLELWFPRVRSGGIFAGHDYIQDGVNRMGEFGVKRAVTEFCQGRGLVVSSTKEKWASWYLIKP